MSIRPDKDKGSEIDFIIILFQKEEGTLTLFEAGGSKDTKELVVNGIANVYEDPMSNTGISETEREFLEDLVSMVDRLKTDVKCFTVEGVKTRFFDSIRH